MGIAEGPSFVQDKGCRYIHPLVVNHELLCNTVKRANVRHRVRQYGKRIFVCLRPILRPEPLLCVDNENLYVQRLKSRIRFCQLTQMTVADRSPVRQLKQQEHWLLTPELGESDLLPLLIL